MNYQFGKENLKAQEKQDEIFKKMSAEQKLDLSSNLWFLGRELNSGSTNKKKEICRDAS